MVFQNCKRGYVWQVEVARDYRRVEQKGCQNLINNRAWLFEEVGKKNFQLWNFGDCIVACFIGGILPHRLAGINCYLKPLPTSHGAPDPLAMKQLVIAVLQIEELQCHQSLRLPPHTTNQLQRGVYFLQLFFAGKIVAAKSSLSFICLEPSQGKESLSPIVGVYHCHRKRADVLLTSQSWNLAAKNWLEFGGLLLLHQEIESYLCHGKNSSLLLPCRDRLTTGVQSLPSNCRILLDSTFTSHRNSVVLAREETHSWRHRWLETEEKREGSWVEVGLGLPICPFNMVLSLTCWTECKMGQIVSTELGPLQCAGPVTVCPLWCCLPN